MATAIRGDLLWVPVLEHWVVVVGGESSPLPVRDVFISLAVLQQQLARVGIVARVTIEERGGGRSLQLRNTSYADQSRLLNFMRQYYPNHPTLAHRINWVVGPMIAV